MKNDGIDKNLGVSISKSVSFISTLATVTVLSLAMAGSAMSEPREEYLRRLIREEISQALAGTSADTKLNSAIKAEVRRIALKEGSKKEHEVEKSVVDPRKQGKHSEEKGSPLELSMHGYGDVRYSFYDYDEGITQPEGSRSDSRSAFDLSRFVVKLEGEYEPAEVGFEAEIEFEHGGTGTAKELEFEEFGEFEDEVENGGEVILEELYLFKKFEEEDLKIKAGRFYVGMGLMSNYYKPTDYLAVSRPESEITVIPAVWDEIGLSVEKGFDWGKFTFQVVNGLDSSGFGSSRWIATGHQEKFEVNKSEDLAFVGRLDLNLTDELLVGASTYYADSTSANRPTDDLDVDGSLFLASAHSVYQSQRTRAKAMFLWGSLDDAAEISDRNSRLSNNLGVPRTPVAEEALASWLELGYDIAPWFESNENHRIEPFFRFDFYDTFYKASEGVFDNERFERSVYTSGLSYTYMDAVTAKLDWSHREFGGSGFDSQNTVRLGLGFVY